MARQTNRLAAVAVARTKKPGLYADGGGLWLQVTKAGGRSWIYRFMQHGRARSMGLGALDTVTLAQARQAATEAREQVRADIDPIDARKAHRQREKTDAAKAITFRQCAEKYIEAHKAGWRNEKHRQQWTNTLETYVHPVFGELPAHAVDVGLVTKVIEPIWHSKPETAGRVRGRIESVLDWAAARGYRSADNPARWRGHLDKLLPSSSKIRRVKHHAAVPHVDIGDFMVQLRERDGVGALALEFLILSAARTSEVTGAQWQNEIAMEKAVWTIPADRMKGGLAHRVPLSDAALSVLERAAKIQQVGFVFPGGRKGKPLSSAAMSALLDRMGFSAFTVHGFRSTFRDWAAERTSYPREVAEAALAHSLPDKTEAAYRRSDLFEKRRRLMNEWAKYCATAKPAGKVVAINRSQA